VRTILYRTGKRADRIKRPAEQSRAVQADPAIGDLEADQTVEGRRNTHRAAGVAANARRREPGRDGDRGTARRPAGYPVTSAIPGIPGRPHQWIGAPGAEGELDHLRLTERDHAGGEETLGGGRGRIGTASGPHTRADRPYTTVNIAKILQADGKSVQGAERQACRPGMVGAVRKLPGLAAIDLDEGVQPAVQALDAGQMRVNDFPARALALPQQFGLLDQRQIREIHDFPSAEDILGGR
jgi:hypothetical protein